ncbi:MAG: DUF5615 family PIN-like protein [Planktothrix sp.]
MSQIRLYFDEDSGNMSLVEALRNEDIDVLTTPEANRMGYSDQDQLLWATQQNRIIYSFNMGDFCRLHNIFIGDAVTHAGIIVVPRQSYSIGEQLRGILRLISQQSAEVMVNQLVFLGMYIRAE